MNVLTATIAAFSPLTIPPIPSLKTASRKSRSGVRAYRDKRYGAEISRAKNTFPRRKRPSIASAAARASLGRKSRSGGREFRVFCAWWISPPHEDVYERGILELGEAEIGAPQLRAAEFGAFQLRGSEIGALEPRLRDIGRP